MYVLGLSFGYHDSSACLVKDGIIQYAIAEERQTQQKHDANFPIFAVEKILKETRISISEIDQIVFHEDPFNKFTRILTSSISNFPFSRKEFSNSAKAWMGKKLWALNEISKKLHFPIDKISYLNHHYSHAATAFMGAGYKESAVLVIDAVGDWASSALYKAEFDKDGKAQLNCHTEVSFPHSLGLLYSAFTGYLGFLPNDSECTTMALAGFGKPIYKDKIEKILKHHEDGTYSIDQRYVHFTDFYKGPVSKEFIKEFGPPRGKLKISFDSFEIKQVSKEEQYYADIAASIQSVLEDAVLNLVRKIKTEVGSENLCLAGGVALNCVLNKAIIESKIYPNLYIPIDPGDGGTSVGSALLYINQMNPELSNYKYQAYLGSEGSGEDLTEFVEGVNPDNHLPFLIHGAKSKSGVKWKSEKFENFSKTNAAAVKLLNDGKIVGRFFSRAEFGPRALGNRSILMKTGDRELAIKLSKRIKHRALYRPYAFSVTEDQALELLDIESTQNYKWMQVSALVRSEKKSEVKACVHIDGTTRPQVCHKEDNPEYYDLLKQFGEVSGIEALLNTSFNPKGYPIVSTELEALVMFARTELDALILNNTLIWKVYD